MRTLRLLAVSLVLLLSACASTPPKRINPPTLSIQRLTMQVSGSYDIELRLQNHSDVTMHFAELDLQLRIAGIDAGQLRAQPDIDVAPHNAEIVELRLAAAMDAAEPLGAAATTDRAERNDTAVHYMLRGNVRTSEPPRDYDIYFESRLSPVPGKSGEFR